jgi:hypothetical protein
MADHPHAGSDETLVDVAPSPPQLGVQVAEAFVRLRAYAYTHDRRLADVARDIVTRRLRLHDDPGRDGAP